MIKIHQGVLEISCLQDSRTDRRTDGQPENIRVGGITILKGWFFPKGIEASLNRTTGYK